MQVKCRSKWSGVELVLVCWLFTDTTSTRHRTHLASTRSVEKWTMRRNLCVAVIELFNNSPNEQWGFGCIYTHINTFIGMHRANNILFYSLSVCARAFCHVCPYERSMCLKREPQSANNAWSSRKLLRNSLLPLFFRILTIALCLVCLLLRLYFIRSQSTPNRKR